METSLSPPPSSELVYANYIPIDVECTEEYVIAAQTYEQLKKTRFKYPGNSCQVYTWDEQIRRTAEHFHLDYGQLLRTFENRYDTLYFPVNYVLHLSDSVAVKRFVERDYSGVKRDPTSSGYMQPLKEAGLVSNTLNRHIFLEKYFDELWPLFEDTHELIDILPYVHFLKDELRLKGKDTRSVSGCNIFLLCWYYRLFGNWYRQFTDNQMPIIIGKDPLAVTTFTEIFSQCDLDAEFIESDISGQDTLYNNFFDLYLLERIRRSNPDPIYEEAKEFWVRSSFAATAIYGTEVNLLNQGNPSGFPATLTKNTESNKIFNCLAEAVMICHGEIGQETPVLGVSHGDDGVKQVMCPNHEHILATTFALGGWFLETSVKKFEDLRFCNFMFRKYHGLVLPYYGNLDRLVAMIRVAHADDFTAYVQKIKSLYDLLRNAPHDTELYRVKCVLFDFLQQNQSYKVGDYPHPDAPVLQFQSLPMVGGGGIAMATAGATKTGKKPKVNQSAVLAKMIDSKMAEYKRTMDKARKVELKELVKGFDTTSFETELVTMAIKSRLDPLFNPTVLFNPSPGMAFKTTSTASSVLTASDALNDRCENLNVSNTPYGLATVFTCNKGVFTNAPGTSLVSTFDQTKRLQFVGTGFGTNSGNQTLSGVAMYEDTAVFSVPALDSTGNRIHVFPFNLQSATSPGLALTFKEGYEDYVNGSITLSNYVPGTGATNPSVTFGVRDTYTVGTSFVSMPATNYVVIYLGPQNFDDKNLINFVLTVDTSIATLTTDSSKMCTVTRIPTWQDTDVTLDSNNLYSHEIHLQATVTGLNDMGNSGGVASNSLADVLELWKDNINAGPDGFITNVSRSALPYKSEDARTKDGLYMYLPLPEGNALTSGRDLNPFLACTLTMVQLMYASGTSPAATMRMTSNLGFLNTSTNGKWVGQFLPVVQCSPTALYLSMSLRYIYCNTYHAKQFAADLKKAAGTAAKLAVKGGKHLVKFANSPTGRKLLSSALALAVGV